MTDQVTTNTNTLSPSSIFTEELRCCVWNILARGLSHGEFLCQGGDSQSTVFGKRFPRIVQMMGEMFDNGVAFISSVENDHPEWILERLERPEIKLLKVLKYPEEKLSNAKKIAKTNERLGFGQDDLLRQELAERETQNDTLSIYYNSQKLEAVPGKDGKLFQQIVVSEGKGKGKGTNDQTWAGFVIFKQVCSGKQFVLVNAHLSSGEAVKDSTSRLEECRQLMDHLYQHPRLQEGLPIVVTMDSNSSQDYQSVKGCNGDDVLDFFLEHGLENGVHLETSQCYKMRHGTGGQPSKFGSLMYDSIDRIFFSESVASFRSLVTDEMSSWKSVHQTLTESQRTNIKEIRQTASRRERLKCLVTGDRDDGLFPWSDIVGMGKNSETGIKEVEKKGQKILVPLYNGDDYAGDLPLAEKSFTELSMEECMALYPNQNNPSDHPPCLCAFSL